MPSKEMEKGKGPSLASEEDFQTAPPLENEEPEGASFCASQRETSESELQRPEVDDMNPDRGPGAILQPRAELTREAQREASQRMIEAQRARLAGRGSGRTPEDYRRGPGRVGEIHDLSSRPWRRNYASPTENALRMMGEPLSRHQGQPGTMISQTPAGANTGNKKSNQLHHAGFTSWSSGQVRQASQLERAPSFLSSEGAITAKTRSTLHGAATSNENSDEDVSTNVNESSSMNQIVTTGHRNGSVNQKTQAGSIRFTPPQDCQSVAMTPSGSGQSMPSQQLVIMTPPGSSQLMSPQQLVPTPHRSLRKSGLSPLAAPFVQSGLIRSMVSQQAAPATRLEFGYTIPVPQTTPAGQLELSYPVPVPHKRTPRGYSTALQGQTSGVQFSFPSGSHMYQLLTPPERFRVVEEPEEPEEHEELEELEELEEPSDTEEPSEPEEPGQPDEPEGISHIIDSIWHMMTTADDPIVERYQRIDPGWLSKPLKDLRYWSVEDLQRLK